MVDIGLVRARNPEVLAVIVKAVYAIPPKEADA
jgi:hypothetical protein